MTKPGPSVTSGADTQPGSDSLFPSGFGGGAAIRTGGVGTGEIADSSVAAADLNLPSVAAALAARSEFTGAYARKAGNTVVLFGDSITQYSGGPQLASPTAFWDSKGFFVWANILLGGRLRVLNNAGVGGNTTAQMRARISTDVLAFNSAWVTVMGGRNNDGVTAGQTVADTIADLTAIFTACLQNGSRVVALTIEPGPTTDTATKIDHDNLVNRWIRDYCRVTPGMVLCDIGAALVDVTTNWRSLASLTIADRVHPNSAGAALAGKALAGVLDPLVPKNDLLPAGTGSDNFLANPYFNGSGTSLPTSWNLQGTAGTYSYVARTDNVQGSWFQVAKANGSAATLITQNASLTGALAVGASCYLALEVQFDTPDPAPSAGTQAFHAYLQCYNGSTFTTKAYAAYWDGTYANVPFPGSNGVFTTTALVIPTGTTLVQTVITMAGGGNYRLGRAALRVGAP